MRSVIYLMRSVIFTKLFANNNYNYKNNIYSQYLFSWANKWWSLVNVKSHRVFLRRVPEQDFHMSFQQMLPIPDDVTVQYGCKDSLSSSTLWTFQELGLSSQQTISRLSTIIDTKHVSVPHSLLLARESQVRT